MPFIDKLPDSLAIRFTGHITIQEKQIRDKLNKGHKLLKWKIDHRDVDWDNYNSTMGYVSKELQQYNGRFKKYFQNYMESLNEEEKDVLGYGSRCVY